MAEFEITTPFYGDLSKVSDLELSEIIREIINQVMIENHVYYDNDDRSDAIDEIYPLCESIILNPNFSHIRADEEAMINLITSLVVHLS